MLFFSKKNGIVIIGIGIMLFFSLPIFVLNIQAQWQLEAQIYFLRKIILFISIIIGVLFLFFGVSSEFEDFHQEQQRKRKEDKLRARRLNRQARIVNRMVKRVLGEVGEAYWHSKMGGLIPNYTLIAKGNKWEVCEKSGIEQLPGEEYDTFQVILHEQNYSFHFEIKCDNGNIRTSDTSEEELIGALRRALERGPSTAKVGM